MYSGATVLSVIRFYGCITCFIKHIMGLQVDIQDFESEARRYVMHSFISPLIRMSYTFSIVSHC